MKKVATALITIFFTASGLFSQSINLSSIIEETARSYNIPGLCVGIVQNNKVVLMEGYGYVNINSKTKVNENTNFYIASLTKAMTSFCVGTLVDSGMVNWDDPIAYYLAKIKFNDTCSGKVLLHDILSMNLGSPYLDSLTLYPELSQDEVFSIASKHSLPNFRNSNAYGQGANIGFVLAGSIIEEITHKEYPKYLTDKIFKPLQMDNSLVYNHQLIDSVSWACPHRFNENGERIILDYPNVGFFTSAAGVISNVNDLTKWLILLTNKGEFYGKRILSEDSFNQIITPHNILSKPWTSFYNPNSHFNLYGYGWVLSEYNSHLLVEHIGSMYGYSSLIAFLPNQKIGIIVLCNIESLDVFRGLRDLKFQIVDELLSKE